MMMIYGMMPFIRQTLPYNALTHNIEYRWPTNDRFGLRPAAQFAGPGADTLVLSGELRPEITGGAISLMTIRLLADQGLAWPLIGGSGQIYGMYVIEKINHVHSEFFHDGAASKIAFTLSLKRVDESFTTMFGDLKTQLDVLSGRVRALPSSITSAIDGVKSMASSLLPGAQGGSL